MNLNKISVAMRNDKIELPYGSYSDNRAYVEFIIKE